MKLTGGAHGFEVGDPVPPSEYTIENPTKDNNNTLTVHFKTKLILHIILALKLHLQVNKLISATIIMPI